CKIFRKSLLMLTIFLALYMTSTIPHLQKILSSWNSSDLYNVENTRSAVELENAGISFQKSEDDILFHIEFGNNAMEIQEWEISDSIESLF
ncbi:Hypothetical predicted protein, partial [Olea europaea subsp. europaea]